MSSNEADGREIMKWDPGLTKRMISAAEPIAKRWFRTEIRGLESFPRSGGALVVSNHSGGILTVDVLLFAAAFYRRFGYDRPLYTLGHDALFVGPLARWMTGIGVIHAGRDNAEEALRSGGVVLVFPGGVYDSYRPTVSQNVIDFNGRTRYVGTAVAAEVPIVPTVSIGGQESQLFLTRGTWLANRLRLNRLRSDILPVTIGFPFGLSAVLPVNIPLPAKIVTEVLEPVDARAEYGDDPGMEKLDEHVRSLMQTGLDRLAGERRFPVLG